MQTPNDPTFDLRNFLESRSKPELIAVIEKMNAPAWTLMFQNMTLTRPEMLAKLDVMVDRLDDLFASVDNETDIDAMDQHLTHIFQKFRGSWALVQNEMEALLGQTLHRLSLALIAGHLDDCVRNQSFEGLRLLELINDFLLQSPVLRRFQLLQTFRRLAPPDMPIGSHWCLQYDLTRPHEYPTIIAHLIAGDFSPDITTILHQLLRDHLTPSQDDAIARWLL